MCRLFGFRSNAQTSVQRSLVQADNGLSGLSEFHPDGWGVGYYVDGTPHVVRGAGAAHCDHVFQRVSAKVASRTVVAHVRKATRGSISVFNSHPFQHGRWLFAHNGDITNFSKFGEQLLGQVSPHLACYVLGETDSEVIFFLILSQLLRYGSLDSRLILSDVVSAVRSTFHTVRALCDGEGPSSLLTCILTDGSTMIAHHGGKELHLAIHRRAGVGLQPEGQVLLHNTPAAADAVDALVLSSEPLGNESAWFAMRKGEIVAVDSRMRLYDSASTRRAISVHPKAF